MQSNPKPGIVIFSPNKAACKGIRMGIGGPVMACAAFDYGARYLDPHTSLWLSADPAMGEYIPQAPINDEAKKHNENLPGMGGVFNYVNLHVYHYAGNNPVKLVDPDGRLDIEGYEAHKKMFKEKQTDNQPVLASPVTSKIPNNVIKTAETTGNITGAISETSRIFTDIGIMQMTTGSSMKNAGNIAFWDAPFGTSANFNLARIQEGAQLYNRGIAMQNTGTVLKGLGYASHAINAGIMAAQIANRDGNAAVVTAFSWAGGYAASTITGISLSSVFTGPAAPFVIAGISILTGIGGSFLYGGIADPAYNNSIVPVSQTQINSRISMFLPKPVDR